MINYFRIIRDHFREIREYNRLISIVAKHEGEMAKKWNEIDKRLHKRWRLK